MRRPYQSPGPRKTPLGRCGGQAIRAQAGLVVALLCALLSAACAGGGGATPANTKSPGQPAVQFSSSNLTFGSQTVGALSAAQAVTLSNPGDAALQITSFAVSGPNASDFAQTNNCGSSLAAVASCTISVTFKPSAAGTLAAAVTLTDNAGNDAKAVSLSGTGVGRSTLASISPSRLTFGNEPVNTASSPQAITLNNTGRADLSITSIAFNGTDATNFTELDTCNSPVEAGGNCTITILFTPSAIGTRTASLAIIDNASGSPQSVSLSGNGEHDVILSWSASTSPAISGYNVFRGSASHSESAMPLNSTPIIGTTYADANVKAGATYYYVVTVVASDDVTQSTDSNETSATVP